MVFVHANYAVRRIIVPISPVMGTRLRYHTLYVLNQSKPQGPLGLLHENAIEHEELLRLGLERFSVLYMAESSEPVWVKEVATVLQPLL